MRIVILCFLTELDKGRAWFLGGRIDLITFSWNAVGACAGFGANKLTTFWLGLAAVTFSSDIAIDRGGRTVSKQLGELVVVTATDVEHRQRGAVVEEVVPCGLLHSRSSDFSLVASPVRDARWCTFPPPAAIESVVVSEPSDRANQ
jgi:hypothetical protein